MIVLTRYTFQNIDPWEVRQGMSGRRMTDRQVYRTIDRSRHEHPFAEGRIADKRSH
jgi:hypothetical protein